MLGLAVPPVTPDAALRDKLFAALDETPQGATVTRGPWTRRLVVAVAASAAAVLVGVLAVGTLVLPQLTRCRRSTASSPPPTPTGRARMSRRVAR